MTIYCHPFVITSVLDDNLSFTVDCWNAEKLPLQLTSLTLTWYTGFVFRYIVPLGFNDQGQAVNLYDIGT